MALNYVPYRMTDPPPEPHDWRQTLVVIVFVLVGFALPIFIVLVHLLNKWEWL